MDNELNTLPAAAEPQAPPPDAPPAEEPQIATAPETTPPGTVNEEPDPASMKAEIEELAKKKQKAEEDARYWRQQKSQARAEYFRDRQKPADSQPAAASELSKPKADDFDDYNDYVDALTDYKVEVKKRAWDQEAANKAANETYQQKQARLQEKINEGFTKYDDFEEVALENSVPITPMVVEILAESDAPADVAYYLGKNRTEAIAISRMTPIAAARAIAKIENQLAATPRQPTKTTTSAPAPIKPIGSGPAAISKNPEKMTQAEYEAWRTSQGARRF